MLALYAEAYDPAYPIVCLDEKPVVLHDQTRSPLPPKPGAVERRDYEYVRQGTADLFVMVEPLAGWRHVAVTERRTRRDFAVTERRTRRDFAECLRYLVEERYPTAAYMRLVVDNLNTHVPAALYEEAYPPQQARAILERLEFHDTPKHGSWLTRAETEISVFERGCLSHPVGDLPTLTRRVSALEGERNAGRATMHGQFTTQQARTKLVKRYPVTETKLD